MASGFGVSTACGWFLGARCSCELRVPVPWGRLRSQRVGARCQQAVLFGVVAPQQARAVTLQPASGTLTVDASSPAGYRRVRPVLSRRPDHDHDRSRGRRVPLCTSGACGWGNHFSVCPCGAAALGRRRGRSRRWWGRRWWGRRARLACSFLAGIFAGFLRFFVFDTDVLR